MKLLKYSLAILLGTSSLWSQTITQASGWLESAYVKWQPVSNATKYNVYVSGNGLNNQKIDDQLIRSYGSYYRADVIGLKAGSYTLKVTAVVGSTEGAGTTTSSLTVLAHDRAGFAFSNGRIPGAYSLDGTPKNGSVILYVSENTKNTVSLNVTGATANPCVGLQTILDGFKKGSDTRPLIIRVIGQVTDLSYMLGGDIVIENAKNASGSITLEGVGDDAVADGWGIRLKNAANIEVRNIATMNVNSSEGDNIGLQQNNEYIWVHNNDFFYGDAGSDADQAKGDGALDCKKSTYVTFSYNHFWDSGKSNLLGLSEGTTSGLYITYHHNWYDHSDSRHPRVRYYSAHVYNNYYDGVSKYGVGSTLGSSVFVEGNYFRNAKYPMMISMQGTDVYDPSTQSNDYNEMPTFSGENGGIIKAYNNYMDGQTRFVPYGAAGYPNSTVDFDAYVTTNRNEKLSTSVKAAYGGSTYNNFDTDASVMYSYTPDSPENAKTKVMTYAGRVNGGDFKWTFNNAVDDASYAVNTALKAALVGYRTSLVSIQGVGSVVIPSSSSGTISSSSVIVSSSSSIVTSSSSNGSSSSQTPIAGTIVHNFTLSGITSSYFNIFGNLSTTKGTVSYAGLTLTQCLKMESATQISFTLASTATLTLVLNSDFTGRVSIDGENFTASAGIVTVTLESGAHVIQKGDTGNLFYMKLVPSAENPTISKASAWIQNPITFNRVNQTIYLQTGFEVHQVQIINMVGSAQQFIINQNSVQLIHAKPGAYVIQLHTNRGRFQKAIIIR